MFVYEVEFSSVVQGRHVYKAAWSPIIGESGMQECIFSKMVHMLC